MLQLRESGSRAGVTDALAGLVLFSCVINPRGFSTPPFMLGVHDRVIPSCLLTLARMSAAGSYAFSAFLNIVRERSLSRADGSIDPLSRRALRLVAAALLRTPVAGDVLALVRGMPVEAFIPTSDRTAISYFPNPFGITQAASSGKEGLSEHR